MSKQYWVIGGEFTSLNFHKFTEGTSIIRGPFSSRDDAQHMWKMLSEQHRHKASYRFIILNE